MHFNPGTVLLMDVTSSAQFPDGEQLTFHLGQTVNLIEVVSRSTHVSASAVHRRGDELFVVSQGYATAYLLAFWIAMTWPFPDFPLYMSAALGNLGGDVPSPAELETWNRPLAKVARNALDALKQQRPANRVYLKFEMDEPSIYITQLNEYLAFQDRFLRNQTEMERQAFRISLVEDRRGEMAKRLHKDISTISRQLKSSNADLILMAKDRILNILQTLESTHSSHHDASPPVGHVERSEPDIHSSNELEWRWQAVDEKLKHFFGSNPDRLQSPGKGG